MLQPTYFKRHNLNFEGRPSSFPVSAARRVAVCRQVHDIHSDCDYSNMLATREITWTFLPVLEIHILSSAKGGCYGFNDWCLIILILHCHHNCETSKMADKLYGQWTHFSKTSMHKSNPLLARSMFLCFFFHIFLISVSAENRSHI